MTVERGWAERGKARARVKTTNMSMAKKNPVVGIMVGERGKQGGGRMLTRASPRPRKGLVEAFKTMNLCMRAENASIWERGVRRWAYSHWAVKIPFH